MKLNRLLIERIDHRILVGTLAFLAIMVLLGWIWINENGRMAAFDRQYLARSIERGAALYAANCSSCHGVDGLGAVGRAPALNSPYLFGHDFLAEIDTELTVLNAERPTAELNGLTERVTEIDARIAELTTERDALIAQMGPAVNIGYDPDSPSRTQRMGWTATLRSLVLTTLVAGRPTSGNYWPQPMASWSQTTGARLRTDQLEDLTNFILNWDKGSNWTLDDLNSVRQFPIYPIDPSTVTIVEGDPRIGAATEIAAVMEGLAMVTGDPQNGQTLYNSATLGCTGCHANAAVAPLLEGTWTRVTNERLTLPEFAGYTGEQYLAESIIHPNDYTVPTYASGVMPQNFGDRLSYQELADMIEYLKTQDQ